MKVKIEHARSLGYCADGIRTFCKRHNLDFREFVLHGIDSEKLLVLDNVLSTRLVERAQLWAVDHHHKQ